MTPGYPKLWPVAVVGAGPNGLTMANLLARYGVDVLLIERNPTTVGEPRAVSIDDEALRTLQAVGVVEQVLRNVVPGYGSDYFTPGGRCFLRVRPTAREYGYPRRNAFRQPILEARLREYFCTHARAGGGSEACFGTELVGFEQNADSVTLRLREIDGAEREVSCLYLVACDGGRSFIREKLGIRLSGSTFRQRWLILDLEETRDEARDTKVFCNPSRPCISLPGPDRTRRFEFMLHEGETEAQVTSADFTRQLLRRYGADDLDQVRRSRVYTFHARMAEQWRQGRIFLAGDAAHLTPPFAGQGMNSGIRDVHNLAWKLAAVVGGRLGPELLQAYEQERRGHAWEMIRLALRMGKVMMPGSRGSAFAVQTIFRLLGLCPPARDYFAQMKYRPKPYFAEGFVARTAASGTGADLVGRLFPQPMVETPSGAILLDEVLGNGFALLSLPHTAPAEFAKLPPDLCGSLNLRRVAICPRGAQAQPQPGVTVVYDVKDELASYAAKVPPGFALIRPDRYVAAYVSAADPAPAISEIEALIARTWNG